MFKPIRMLMTAVVLVAALVLSACGSALGNVSLNDLILTATALNGTLPSHGAAVQMLQTAQAAYQIESSDVTGTPEMTETLETKSPESIGTPRAKMTPEATGSEVNNAHEVFGTVVAYTPAAPGTPGSITLDNNLTYLIANQSVVSKCSISVGTAVHIEFGINPDGTYFVHHLGLATGNGMGDCNGNSQGQNGQNQNGQGQDSGNGGTPHPGDGSGPYGGG
jgi:hypothetical protein